MTVGRVSRLCLGLGVIPVFVPPREPSFQPAMEAEQGSWQAKVWSRFEHADPNGLQDRSRRHVTALRYHPLIVGSVRTAARPRRPASHLTRERGHTGTWQALGRRGRRPALEMKRRLVTQ